MSIRDLGVIEITVFMAVLAAFLMFFGMFVMLRHRKAKSRRQKFSGKQLAMEDAMRQRMNHGLEEEEYAMFASQQREHTGQDAAAAAGRTQSASQRAWQEHNRQRGGRQEAAERTGAPGAERAAQAGSEKARRSHTEEPMRMWDTNSKAVRTMKKPQKEAGAAAGTFYVEERRISHRRDQLKRLEEVK